MKARIDFSKVPCYVDITKAKKQDVDLRFELSNTMYVRGSGIAMGALAMKIYNGNGEQEFDEKECNILLSFLEKFAPMLYDSFKDLMKETNHDNIQ